ncbi:MAG TPA: TolC family protein [Longimicrobiales bacterium]|nr:TolC family protein [Longimicrobiales bacterium]
MNIPHRGILLAMAGLLAGVVPVAAQEARRVTLEEAIRLFATNNIELRLARADAAEAAALATQAAAWPNPALVATHEPLSAGGWSYSETYLNLSQRLEWPGTRAARRESAEQGATAAAAGLAADSARLAFEVKRAWTGAAMAERAEAVLGRVTEVFREGERSADERFSGGDISLYDRGRIRVERLRYETRLAEAAIEAAAARRRLAQLIDPAGQTIEMGPADSLSGSPAAVAADRVLARALARRAEIAAAEAALASARAGASVARGERIPDVTATGGLKNQSDGLTGAFLGLSIPLPLWDRRDGAIDAADARVAAAGHRISLIRRQVESDVRRALDVYTSLAERARLYGPADEAVDLLDIARVAYGEGEMELIDLLDAAEALSDAQIAEIRLRADLWTSYYDLERAVGGFDGPMNGRDER